MARKSEISYESVAVECIELWAKGQSASFENVYEKLGRRAPAAVVQQFVAQWQTENADRLVAKHAHLDLPVELVAASEALLRQAWQTALVKAEGAYAEAQHGLERERAKTQSVLAQSSEKTLFAEREFLRLSGKVHGLRAEILAKDSELHKAGKRLDEVSQALAIGQGQIAELGDRLARAQATIEADRLRHADDLAALVDRHARDLAAQRARNQQTPGIALAR